MLCSAHLVVSDQKQTHQRGVEDRLGDVGRLSLEAFLSHKGSTQGLTRALHVDATGSRHPSFTGKPQKRLPKGIPQKDKKASQSNERQVVFFAPQTGWVAPPQFFHMQGQR